MMLPGGACSAATAAATAAAAACHSPAAGAGGGTAGRSVIRRIIIGTTSGNRSIVRREYHHHRTAAAAAAASPLLEHRLVVVPTNTTNTGTIRHKTTSLSVSGIPEVVRDYVKNQVLDEVTKPGSNIWVTDQHPPPPHPNKNNDNDDASEIFNGRQKNHRLNGCDDGRVSSRTGGYGDVINGEEKDHQHSGGDGGTGTTINDAIRSGGGQQQPYYYDPLDEWHLDDDDDDDDDDDAPSSLIQPLQHREGVRPMEDGADPFVLAKPELDLLTEGIRRDLIGTDHPVLQKAAGYFFQDASSADSGGGGGGGGGKKVRPVMVMLLSQALKDCCGDNHHPQQQQQQRHDLIDAQRRLAQISEMIHTASLFHDDVIDDSDYRRNIPSVHKVFGNKMAILAGDFLLARASIYLARLRDVEVVETMSTIIEHLVRGEVMQMKPPPASSTPSSSSSVASSFSLMGGGTTTSTTPTTKKTMMSPEVKTQLEYYLRKNFYKTASLMANSCKSTAILGNYSNDYVRASYLYGKHVGLAFQLVDDVLDYEGDTNTMGKPALADLKAGLATAPALYALDYNDGEYSKEMSTYMKRKFRHDGDIERAVDIIHLTGGIDRTKRLARRHVETAIDAIMGLEVMDEGGDGSDDGGSGSPSRDALVHLAYKIVDRTR